MSLTREDYKFNHDVERRKRIDSFPRQAKIMIGASILSGLILALILFIVTVRTSEKIVQMIDN